MAAIRYQHTHIKQANLSLSFRYTSTSPARQAKVTFSLKAPPNTWISSFPLIPSSRQSKHHIARHGHNANGLPRSSHVPDCPLRMHIALIATAASQNLYHTLVSTRFGSRVLTIMVQRPSEIMLEISRVTSIGRRRNVHHPTSLLLAIQCQDLCRPDRKFDS